MPFYFTVLCLQIFLNLSKMLVKLEYFQFTNISGLKMRKNTQRENNLDLHFINQTKNTFPRLSYYPSLQPHNFPLVIDTIPILHTILIKRCLFLHKAFPCTAVHFIWDAFPHSLNQSFSSLKIQYLPRSPPLTARLASNIRLE